MIRQVVSCINVQALEKNTSDDEDERECHSDNDSFEQPENIRRHLPPPTGTYSIGCVDIMDNNIDEGPFFRLYYPTETTNLYKRNTQWPLWLPRKQYGFGYANFLRRNPKNIVGKIFNWIGGDVYVPCLWQAPIFDSSDKFPVIVLSHGIGGNRTTYSTLCCELASYGFIVAALEHRDGSASMTYLLKDSLKRCVVELVKDPEYGKNKPRPMHRSHSFKEEWRSFEHTDPLGIQWDDYAYRNKQVLCRASECTRLLDMLEEINKGRSVRNSLGFHFSLKQFKDRIDVSKVALVGHSFGGSTCVSTLGSDQRFKVGVMLDAWMHPLDETMCNSVTQPLLMLNYEKFQWKKNVQQMKWLEKEGTERPMLTILGACHQACSDFQFIVSKTFGRVMEVRSELSPKVALDLNKRSILGFLYKHLGLEEVDEFHMVLEGKHKLVIIGTTLDIS